MTSRAAHALAATILIALAVACDGGPPTATDGDCRFVIATMGDLSGPREARSLPMLRGVQLAVDEADQSGDLRCRLELQIEDTNGDPDLARRHSTTLARSERVLACFCAYTSEEALAAGPALSAAGILISGPAMSPAVSEQGFNSWFAAAPDSEVETTATVTYIRQALGPSSVAVLDDGSEWGKAVADRVASGLGDLSNLRATAADDPAAQVAAASPEVVYVGGEGDEPAVIAGRLRAGGSDAVVVANSDALLATLPQTTPEEGFFVTCPCVAPNGIARGSDFTEVFEGAYDAPPGPFAAEMYDVTRLALRALEGAAVSATPNALRQRVLGAFNSAEGVPGIAHPLSWTASGEFEAEPAEAAVWVYEWRGAQGAFASLASVRDLL
jgi:branched-chain amino acid transport system substrate-binding protein